LSKAGGYGPGGQGGYDDRGGRGGYGGGGGGGGYGDGYGGGRGGENSQHYQFGMWVIICYYVVNEVIDEEV